MKELYINGVKIEYNDDIIVNNFQNKSLNYRNIKFTLDNKMDAKIKDYVLYGDENYYLLDFEETEMQDYYNYSVNIVEPTIELYDIILPNRVITRRLELPRKSAIEIIEGFLLIYAPHLKLSNNLKNKIGGITVGDFAWNNPTLFGVINDIIRAELNIIPVMRSFTEIDFKDLDMIGNPINEDNITSIKRKNDYNEYGKRAVFNLSDARYVGAKNKDPYGFDYEGEVTAVIEYIKPHTANSAILKDTDWAIYTEHDIDEIYEVRFTAWRDVFFVDETSDLFKKEFDMSDKIVERSVYDTLKPSNDTGVISGNYKRDKVYYEHGSNKIDGWNYNERTWVPIIGDDKYTWQNIFMQKTGENQINTNLYKPQTFIITVAYKPMLRDISGNLIKNKSNINRDVMLGQEEKTVNIEYFGRNMRNILEQLGEDELIITGINEVPNIMDYYGNFYVTRTEVIDSANGLAWYAYLKENYNEINISTALNYDKRFFERVGADDIVLSNHITNINYYLSDENKNNLTAVDNNLIDMFIKRGFTDLFYSGQFYTFFRFKYEDGSTSKWFVKNNIPFSVDNALILNFKAVDNYSLGFGSDKVDFFDVLNNKNQGITQPYIPYVDNNGEFERIDMRIYSGVYRFMLTEDDAKDLAAYPVARQGVVPYTSPIDNRTDKLVYSENDIYRFKDNREVTSETVQFNFLNDNNTIIYPRMFERNKLATVNYTNTDNYVNLRLYVNRDSNKRYNRRTKIMGEDAGLGNVSFDSNSITVNISGKHYGWLIYEENVGLNVYKPLIAYNGNKSKLYFNKYIDKAKPPVINKEYRQLLFTGPNGDIFKKDIIKKPVKFIFNNDRLLIKYSDDSDVLFNDDLNRDIYDNTTSSVKYYNFYLLNNKGSGSLNNITAIIDGDTTITGDIENIKGFFFDYYINVGFIKGSNNAAIPRIDLNTTEDSFSQTYISEVEVIFND